MGVRKESLKFCDLTCLELAIDACARAGVGKPIVVTRTDRRGALESDFARAGVRATFAINEQPELGQTSSLRAGLERIENDTRAFLIYPVDHPLVRPRDIRRLCEIFFNESPSPLVVVPSFQRRRGHPVLVDVSLAAPLLALVPAASAREVLATRREQTRYVEFDDDRVLVDMDTPDAYERCLARYVFG